MAGSKVIPINSSDEKVATLRDLRADYVVNRKTQRDWPYKVRELTNGRGLDLVVEVAGGSTMKEVCDNSTTHQS